MRRGVRSFVVTVALATALVGCTSNPPQPSAGTQTQAPSASADASPAVPQTPASTTEPSAESTTNIIEPSPSAATTPAATTPSASALAMELATQGSLTVCMALLGAPAASLDQDNQPYGYNVAFANEIASRLNLQPVIQQQTFDALISMVQGHTCDISVSSQNITSDRSAQVNLIPYTQAKLGFPVVVAINNPDNIQTLADLCGRDVSTALGSTFVDQVNGTGDYVTSGLNAACANVEAKPINLHTYPSELDAVQALLDNSVAAYLGNSNFVSEYPDLIQSSPATLPPTRQGIAVALDHPNLTAAVSAALNAMISDGTYLKILEQYVPAQSVDNFSIIERQ